MWSVGRIGAVAGEENIETLEVERVEAVRIFLLLLNNNIFPFIVDDRYLCSNGFITGSRTNTTRSKVGEQSEKLVFGHVGSDADPEKWMEVFWYATFVHTQTLETLGTTASFFILGATRR